MSYSPRFRQKSEQLMQRQSRTSGELLLPVSRRPSHREITSQRNNEAPSRISNRTCPWWFTWQTVALLLCYWIVTQYHAMTQLIKIALSQFSDSHQTNNISQELSETLHKLGPCQKLLTTNSDLTKITTKDFQCTGSILGKQCHSSQVHRFLPHNLSAFLEDISISLRGNLVLMVKNSLHFSFNISSEKLHHNQIMVSFDVEWLSTTVPVKETVQVLLIKLESDHETKPF